MVNTEVLIHKLVSPYNIVREVNKGYVKPYSLPINVYSADVGVVRNELSNSPVSWCTGAGFSRSDALIAALGEAVERYSWLTPPIERAIISAQSKLSCNFIPINKANLIFRKDLTSKQILEKFSDIEIVWMIAKSLADSREFLFPTIDIFQKMLPLEITDWVVLTTNGIAADTIFERACLSAVYEIIERDASMQFWYKKELPRRVILLNTQNDGLIQLQKRAKLLGLEISIFDITNDIGIPSTFAFIYHNKKGYERIACGSACRLGVYDAAVKALTEASAMWNSLDDLRKYKPRLLRNEVLKEFPNIKAFDDHVLLYTHTWAKEGYTFLLNGEGKLRRDMVKENNQGSLSIKDKLKLVVNRLKKKGYDTLILDITPEDVKELGFHVVRAVVPGLVPLFVGKYVNFFSERLPQNAILNQWTHPFP